MVKQATGIETVRTDSAPVAANTGTNVGRGPRLNQTTFVVPVVKRAFGHLSAPTKADLLAKALLKDGLLAKSADQAIKMVVETVGTSGSQWIVPTGLRTDSQVPEIVVADLKVLIEVSQDPILPLGQRIPVATHAVVKSIRLEIVLSNRDMARFQS